MGRNIKILLAENDAVFLGMLENALLESQGLYSLRNVCSGADCMAALQQEAFDILILDYALPDGSGLDWLRRFNELGIAVPTIFVTSKGDSRLAMEAMRAGIFDYVNRSAECAKALPFVVHRAIEGHSLMLEKVRLQKELIETKNFLESIVENAGDAISVVDLEGKVLFWNKGAERLYGFRQEEALGRKLFEVLSWDNESRAQEKEAQKACMARIRAGELIPYVEVKRRAKDGREINTSMTVSPLRNAAGDIIGASRICRDITHLKRAEERLIQAERLSCLGELTAGVAHELRNPLAGIKINTQVLSRRKDLPEIDRRLIHSTLEGIEKIQKIVDDMLHFAKPKPAHFKRVAVNAIVEKSLAILPTKLKGANISLRFEPGEDLPPLWVDEHQIQQVLINLMLNAIQAMENGGVLTLRTFQENDAVAISVQDTGVGIAPKHLKKIFDPFFTTKSEGTGLGLSISLKIVESHGAALDVTSRPGEGSTFTIRFAEGEKREI